MKEDKAITAVGVLAVIMSLLMMSVGRFIMGGITLLIAFGIFWNVIVLELALATKGFDVLSFVVSRRI